MQNDYRACESHNQRGRAKRPKSVEITGDSAPDPKYEHSEPNRLQPQGDYHHAHRYADLTK
jgi:hypothetical protein